MQPHLQGLRLGVWCMLIVSIVDAHSYGHHMHYNNPYAAPPQSHHYAASSASSCRVKVYPRGFTMSMPANQPEVNIVRFEGTCRHNGRVGKFSHVVREPIDGQWTYANNDVQLAPGDIINFRVLGGNRMRRGGFVWDEQAFTVDDIEQEPNPFYPEPSYTSPSDLTPLLTKFKDILVKAATPPNSYLPPQTPPQTPPHTPPPRSPYLPHPDDDAEIMTHPHPTPPPAEPEAEPKQDHVAEPDSPQTQPELPLQLKPIPPKNPQPDQNQPEVPQKPQNQPKPEQPTPKQPEQKQKPPQTPPYLPPMPPQLPPTVPQPETSPQSPTQSHPTSPSGPPPTFLPPPPLPDLPPPPPPKVDNDVDANMQPPTEPPTSNQQGTTPIPPNSPNAPSLPTSSNNPPESPACPSPPSSEQCACATPPPISGSCPPASLEPQCTALSEQLADILRHVQFIEQRTGQLLDKVDTLEEMQAGMLSEQQNRSRHLLLTEPPVDRTHALRDVRNLVADRLELPALRNAIVRARPIDEGVVLTCRSVSDKLRILYRAQKRADVAHVVLQDYQPSDADKDLQDEMASLERAYAGFDENISLGKNSSEWSSASYDVRIDGDAEGGDEKKNDDVAADKSVKPKTRGLAWN